MDMLVRLRVPGAARGLPINVGVRGDPHIAARAARR